MEIMTKDFPVVAGEATDEYPNGSFEVILSAPTKDRDGEVIDSKAFDPLPEHITFDTDHSMTCDSVVGSGTPSYADDGTLRVKGGYASDERSQVIRQKVAEGHIRTTSVTFMSAERVEKDGIPHVVKGELLNGTFTPIPSNRESVVLTAKSIVQKAASAKVGARNSASDAQNIQVAHDAMVAIGASCEEKSMTGSEGKRVIPDEAKSIIGSLEAQRDRVSDALSDAYPNQYCYIRGVLPDVVVFDVWAGGEDVSYRQAYTDDGSVVTLTGTPEEVDVMEIVLPDADANLEPKSTKVSDTEKSADQAASDSAAKAAETDTAKSADEGSDRLAAQAESKAAALALIEGIA